ncbi:MAG: alpha/beta hydrolase [Ruminococcaceae bacterium]|nr:alpha/beta hydrolase [Oscillospiraceae bacterium]
MKKSRKYTYEKDLKIFSLINPPVVLPLLPLMQFFMKAFYYTDFADKALSVKNTSFPSEGCGKIPVRIYSPKEKEGERLPCIIFYHGGGFVYNAAPHHFTLAKNLAKAVGARVILPDYRLAPKHPFPAAVNDALDTYLFVRKNAATLGIDENKIALCGDSAGGNLSAVTCLIAKERGIPQPAAQLLLYPFVDGDAQSPSMKEFTDTPMCNSKAAVHYNKAYIPEGTTEKPYRFSAVDAPDHSGLAEAYIETAEFDCLHDGGVKYFEKLKKDGTRAVLFETKGTMHGYDIAIKSKTYALCMKKRTEFLKSIFAD